MALSPAVGASNLTAALAPAACLNPDGSVIDKTGLTPNITGFPAAFASGYDAYVLDGEVVGAVSDGGDFSIIENYLKSGATNPVTFGHTLARYWATVHLTPAGGYLSVTNDAMSFKDLFVVAVEASMTDVASNPPFMQFVSNVQNIAVSAITWTAMKIMVPSPVPITSKIA